MKAAKQQASLELLTVVADLMLFLLCLAHPRPPSFCFDKLGSRRLLIRFIPLASI